jgi:hypothetical protein
MDPEFLLAAYNNIKEQEMTLRDDEKPRIRAETVAGKAKTEMLHKE